MSTEQTLVPNSENSLPNRAVSPAETLAKELIEKKIQEVKDKIISHNIPSDNKENNKKKKRGEVELSEEQMNVSAFLEKVIGKDFNQVRTTILNRIVKEEGSLRDFSSRRGITVSPLIFPNPSAGIIRLRNNSGPEMMPYFDGVSSLQSLGRNTINRSVTINEVFALTVSMLTGDYDENNPDGIYFDTEGRIVNGQKRCIALVVASIVTPDIKLQFPVEYNHSPNIMKVIDINEKRTLAHKGMILLKQKGVHFDNNYYQGIPVNKIMEVINQMYFGDFLSDDEKIEIFENHKDLIVSFIKVLRKPQGQLHYNASWAASFIKAALPEFFGEAVIMPLADRLVNQIFTGDGDSIQELYNRLVNCQTQKRGEKLSPPQRYGLTTKAIRKSLVGEYTKSLRVTDVDWTVLEANDYRLYGKESSVVRNLSGKNTLKTKKRKAVKRQVLDENDAE